MCDNLTVRLGIEDKELSKWEESHNIPCSYGNFPSSFWLCFYDNDSKEEIGVAHILDDCLKYELDYNRLAKITAQVKADLDMIGAPYVSNAVCAIADMPKNIWGWWGTYFDDELDLIVMNLALFSTVTDKELQDVIAHEYLHSGTREHGHEDDWLYWSERMNNELDYGISAYAQQNIIINS